MYLSILYSVPYYIVSPRTGLKILGRSDGEFVKESLGRGLTNFILILPVYITRRPVPNSQGFLLGNTIGRNTIILSSAVLFSTAFMGWRRK
jgi:hypothetical protein